MNKFMETANNEAMAAVALGDGGPFGAVIVRDGAVVAQAHNEVIKNNDPTAHAEVVAIRRASVALGRFDLADCVIYASCEPCPMCLAAIFWARIKTAYYGCTRLDAAASGFDDNLIYEYIKNPAAFPRSLRLIAVDSRECRQVMEFWQKKTDKTLY